MTLILLGGCFWGLEYALAALPGVTTEAGYAGGPPDGVAATYYNLDVTGHAEAVRVRLAANADLDVVLKTLTEKSMNDPSPATLPRYRRAILCPDAATSEAVRKRLNKLGTAFETAVDAGFHRAEPYHQGYYRRMLDAK